MKKLEIDELMFETEDETVELLEIAVDGYGNKRIVGYRIDKLIKPCTWTIDGISVRGTACDLIPVDKFKELKQAYKDGAIIGVQNKKGDFCSIEKPLWLDVCKYLIKGDIGIAQWNRHGEVIKAFWRDEEIQYESEGCWFSATSPDWSLTFEYRVKPTTQELSIAEISERLGYEVKVIK